MALQSFLVRWQLAKLPPLVYYPYPRVRGSLFAFFWTSHPNSIGDRREIGGQDPVLTKSDFYLGDVEIWSQMSTGLLAFALSKATLEGTWKVPWLVQGSRKQVSKSCTVTFCTRSRDSNIPTSCRRPTGICSSCWSHRTCVWATSTNSMEKMLGSL